MIVGGDHPAETAYGERVVRDGGMVRLSNRSDVA